MKMFFGMLGIIFWLYAMSDTIGRQFDKVLTKAYGRNNAFGNLVIALLSAGMGGLLVLFSWMIFVP